MIADEAPAAKIATVLVCVAKPADFPQFYPPQLIDTAICSCYSVDVAATTLSSVPVLVTVRHVHLRAHRAARHACLRHACLRHACLRHVSHACLRDACIATIVSSHIVSAVPHA